MSEQDIAIDRLEQHEWIEVGARRWRITCDSFQRRVSGKWCDDLVGLWPLYCRTDKTKHRE